MARIWLAISSVVRGLAAWLWWGSRFIKSSWRPVLLAQTSPDIIIVRVDIITSRANPKVKQARALRTRKERDAAGLFLVEGIAHVAAAIEAGAAIDIIFYAPGQLTSPFARELVSRASNGGVPCYALSPEVFETLSDKDNPAGLLAVVRKPAANLQSLNTNNQSFFVAIHSPQDPGNIGAILRTLDAVNAGGLLLLDGGADPHHPGAVRASMGALFHRPVVPCSFAEFADWAHTHGVQIVGTSAHAETDYRAASYQRPLTLLMGSEQKGLSPEHLARCDLRVRLPMQGKVSSLNLAVAAGVMLYEIRSRGA
jgi:TrmH family RNA methyltransferase